MKRIRIERRKARRTNGTDEVLPADPRDPDIVRAKAVRSGLRGADGRARSEAGAI